MVGADLIRSGAPGGGRRTIRARCGVIGSTPAGGVRTMRPERGCALGIKSRGWVTRGSRSLRASRLTRTPSDDCATVVPAFMVTPMPMAIAKRAAWAKILLPLCDPDMMHPCSSVKPVTGATAPGSGGKPYLIDRPADNGGLERFPIYLHHRSIQIGREKPHYSFISGAISEPADVPTRLETALAEFAGVKSGPVQVRTEPT